jgi:hypothetical protein
VEQNVWHGSKHDRLLCASDLSMFRRCNTYVYMLLINESAATVLPEGAMHFFSFQYFLMCCPGVSSHRTFFVLVFVGRNRCGGCGPSLAASCLVILRRLLPGSGPRTMRLPSRERLHLFSLFQAPSSQSEIEDCSCKRLKIIMNCGARPHNVLDPFAHGFSLPVARHHRRYGRGNDAFSLC